MALFRCSLLLLTLAATAASAALADEPAPVVPVRPDGHWVYTPDYGWLWVPSTPEREQHPYPGPGSATMPAMPAPPGPPPAGTPAPSSAYPGPGSATMPAMPAPPGPPPAGTPR